MTNQPVPHDGQGITPTAPPHLVDTSTRRLRLLYLVRLNGPALDAYIHFAINDLNRGQRMAVRAALAAFGHGIKFDLLESPHAALLLILTTISDDTFDAWWEMWAAPAAWVGRGDA